MASTSHPERVSREASHIPTTQSARELALPAGRGGYGVHADEPDSRDHPYVDTLGTSRDLPKVVDLRAEIATVVAQGDLQSCTACAVTSAMAFRPAHTGRALTFSPLFLYYTERTLRREIGKNAGGSVRDACKAAARWGACTERSWPYRPDQVENKPPARAYTQARKYRIPSYERLPQDAAELRRCLAHGSPFVFAFSAYTGFESQQVGRTGRLRMPGRERFLGNHAVLCVGYDDVDKQFLVLNSWGREWGMKGYFSMPYRYLLDPDLTRDCWVLRRATGSRAS